MARPYKRVSTRQAILADAGTRSFSDAVSGLNRIRNTGKSLSSVKKKKAKKAAMRTTTVKLPKKVDIDSITEITDFVSGPIRSAGWTQLDRTIKMVVIDIDTTLREKTRQWARETLAEMRAVTPVDSGNLRDSLDILTKNALSNINATVDVVDRKGPIQARVGINEAKLLPPPTYKDSTKRFTSGKYGPVRPVKVRIPPYNYAPLADTVIKVYHDEGYPGYDFLEKWQEIALNNLERIFK